jgi:flagellar biosynthesis/type III secretory pathway protein FliH
MARLTGLKEKEASEDASRAAVVEAARSIQQAIAGIHADVATNLQSVAALSVEIGLAIAKEVVGDVVAEGLIDPSQVVLRCLRMVVRGSQTADVRIELNPEDLNLVVSHLGSDSDLVSEVGQMEFVANPALGRSCVKVSTDSGCLVYDPEEVLARICDEVRKETVGDPRS